MTEKTLNMNIYETNDIHNEVKAYYKLKTTFKKSFLLNNEKELFILEKEFLKKWKIYVNYKDHKQKEESNYYLNLNKNNNVTYSLHPGTINNSKLLIDTFNDIGIPYTKDEECILKQDSDKYFVLVNKGIWDLFHSKYGGGPTILKKLELIKTPFNYKYVVDLYHSMINLIILPEGFDKNNVENLVYKRMFISSYSKINVLKDKIYSSFLNNFTRIGDIKMYQFSSNIDELKKFLYDILSLKDYTKNNLNSQNLQSLDDNHTTICKELQADFIIVDCSKILDYFQKQFKLGKCNWCEETLKLNYNCLCMEISYCSNKCLENDKRFHLEKCKSYIEKTSIYMSSLSKNGIVGLKNLGNTCYMNTALQCISNCYELTNYFLNNHYKHHLNTTNNNGAKGLIAKSFADLVTNLWYGKDSVFSPTSFKRVLDELKSYFTGYQQHDSQEFLIYLLDQLHEDLNRMFKKTFFTTTISDNDDTIKSLESWQHFLGRNQSIIIDLFFGQFKSSLYCLNCENKSITFDSFSFIPLPLVPKMFTFETIVYFIFYDCSISPIKINLIFNSDCSIMALRNKIADIMEIHPFSFLIFKLDEKGDISIFLNSSIFIKGSLQDGNYPMYLIQLNPEIFNSSSKFVSKPMNFIDFKGVYKNILSNISKFEKKLIESSNENESGQTSDEFTFYSHNFDFKKRSNFNTKYNVDNNYGLSNNYLNTLLHFKTYTSEMKYVIDREKIIFPRIITIDKNWTLKKVHLYIFSYIKQILIENEKDYNLNEYFKKLLKSDCNEEELFNYFFKDFNTSNENDSIEYHLTHNYPYRLRIFSIDDLGKCYYCGRNYCEDCLLPFIESITLGNFLSCLPKNNDRIIDNSYFFINEIQRSNYKRMDFILELTFQPKYIESLKLLNQYKEINFNFLKKETSSEESISINPNISIYDCLNNFVKYEILQDFNEWECQYCKKNQQSKKKIEIFKSPHILIIQLKRFSTNIKLDTFVEFPIEGLNLENYVICKDNIEESDQNIYDLFAVSKHTGKLGSGHYIAYAKNYYNKHWYKFDDSNVSRASESDIVCRDAYVLFYRKRNNKLNLEDLYKQPIINYETTDFSSTGTLTNRSNQ